MCVVNQKLFVHRVSHTLSSRCLVFDSMLTPPPPSPMLGDKKSKLERRRPNDTREIVDCIVWLPNTFRFTEFMAWTRYTDVRRYIWLEEQRHMKNSFGDAFYPFAVKYNGTEKVRFKRNWCGSSVLSLGRWFWHRIRIVSPFRRKRERLRRLGFRFVLKRSREHKIFQKIFNIRKIINLNWRYDPINHKHKCSSFINKIQTKSPTAKCHSSKTSDSLNIAAAASQAREKQEKGERKT